MSVFTTVYHRDVEVKFVADTLADRQFISTLLVPIETKMASSDVSLSTSASQVIHIHDMSHLSWSSSLIKLLLIYHINSTSTRKTKRNKTKQRQSHTRRLAAVTVRSSWLVQTSSSPQFFKNGTCDQTTNITLVEMFDAVRCVNYNLTQHYQ